MLFTFRKYIIYPLILGFPVDLMSEDIVAKALKLLERDVYFDILRNSCL